MPEWLQKNTSARELETWSLLGPCLRVSTLPDEQRVRDQYVHARAVECARSFDPCVSYFKDVLEQPPNAAKDTIQSLRDIVSVR